MANSWLVMCDVDSVQAWLLRSVHLREIAGASQLLVDHDEGLGAVAKGGEILFAGGAELMRRQAMVPLYRAVAGRRSDALRLLDIGTGTGRMLELFAPRCRSAVGIDTNRNMLNVARANLDAADLAHAEVRLGDVANMPVARDAFDLVTIHQVLHFLDDPAAAVAQAARSLAPGGRLVIVDFAPHDLEFLREEHQHLRLGFDTATGNGWFVAAGLDNARAEALAVDGGKAEGQLTVMIWAADDPRIQIADDNRPEAAKTEAA